MADEVTYYWITRDNVQYEYCPVLLWAIEPKLKLRFSVWRYHGTPYKKASIDYRSWLAMFPCIKLKKGEIRKIKRTSLPNGFTWEVCG